MCSVTRVWQPVQRALKGKVKYFFGRRMSTVQEDRAKYCSMSQEEKRSFCKDVITLDQVPTWEEYFRESRETLQKQFADTYKTPADLGIGEYKIDLELNKKISLWQGNLVKLEVDAIVNAANSRLLGGGGDVFHTVGPKNKERRLLESCYKKTLNLLLEHDQRSIAFPCISTGVYGYPQEDAAKVALGTVRKFLETNGSKVDRVVFCLFLPEDVKIYENLAQVYFPSENSHL